MKPTSLPAHSFPLPEEIFKNVYSRQYLPVYEFIHRRTRDSTLAEDLCQNVFLKFWETRDRFLHIKNIDAYVFRMAKNEIISNARKQLNKQQLLEKLQQTTTSSHNVTENDVLTRELEQLLSHAIRALPPRRQMIYRLRKQEGWEISRIAAVLQIKEPTVKTTLKQAVKAVRKFIRCHIDVMSNGNSDMHKLVMRVTAVKAA